MTTNFDEIAFTTFNHTYYVNNIELTSVTKFFKEYQPEVDFNALAEEIARNKSKQSGSPVSAYEIKREWEQNRNKGDLIHESISRILKDGFRVGQFELFSTRHPEQEAWENWYRGQLERSKLRPQFVEWVIGDKELKLGGRVDVCFGFSGNPNLVIADWKTGSIKKTPYGDERSYMLPPFNHLLNCNFVHYSLQLSAYKLIIERNTDYRIKKMFIMQLTEGGVISHDAVDYSKLIKEVILG